MQYFIQSNFIFSISQIFEIHISSPAAAWQLGSVHRGKKQVCKISCTPQAYKAILNTCFKARARGRGERLPPEKKPCKSAFAFERNLAAARRDCWVSSVRRGPIEDGEGPCCAPNKPALPEPLASIPRRKSTPHRFALWQPKIHLAF